MFRNNLWIKLFSKKIFCFISFFAFFRYFLFHFFSVQQLQKSAAVKQQLTSGRVVVQKTKNNALSPPRKGFGGGSASPSPTRETIEQKKGENEEDAADHLMEQEEGGYQKRSGRPAVVANQKFVVQKKKDISTKITHQYIVAKTLLSREKALRRAHSGDEEEDEEEEDEDEEREGEGEEFTKNITIDFTREDDGEGEDQKSFDLMSNTQSLTIDTLQEAANMGGIKLDDEDHSLTLRDTPKSRQRTGSPKARGTPDSFAVPDYAAAKTQQLQLDMPDKKRETRRKYALAISQVLSQQKKEKAAEFLHVVQSAMENAGLFEDHIGDSDDNSVNHYWDRTAKPIFVGRQKPIAKRAKKTKKRGDLIASSFGSRRSGKSSSISGSMGDELDYGFDSDEDEEGGEGGGGRREDPAVVEEMNAAILDLYLEELSSEERQMFEHLDEPAKQKLLKEMRKAAGTAKRKNDKTKSLFQKLTKAATVQAKVHKMMGMELNVEIVEITDESCTFSVTSDQSGPVVAVLCSTNKLNSKSASTQGEPQPPSKEQFYTMNEIQSLGGYIEHREVLLQNDLFEELTFTNLRPETSYSIFVVLNKSSRDHFPITDEVNEKEEEEGNRLIQNPKLLTLRTLEEKLEFEWSRLNGEMRTVELRAAIRSELVQIKSLLHYPVIQLPTDAEILDEKFQTLLQPEMTNHQSDPEKLSAFKEQHFNNNPALKHIPIFLDWWVGHHKSTGKTRIAFHEIESFFALMNKKIQKSLLEDKIFSNKDINGLMEYVKTNLKSRTRLNREEGNNLHVESYDTQDERYLLFKKFRSWYKGGFAIKEMEMKREQRLNSQGGKSLLRQSFSGAAGAGNVSPGVLSAIHSGRTSPTMFDQELGEHQPPPSSPGSGNNHNSTGLLSASVIAQQRLVERTEFLSSLLDNLDKCIKQVQKLFDGYEAVVKKSFKSLDLKTKRNSLSVKEAKSIMEAKKFVDLCLTRKLLTRNLNDDEPFPLMELSKLDPFKNVKKTRSESTISMTPTSKNAPKTFPITFVLQKISGADLFRPVAINTLKPDEPPPLELKCYPGSTRRPNKPWQSLLKSEQDLELALACSLDSVWELAMDDGIALPNPEDRLLPPTEFPLRAQIWEKFRVWYAGDEELEIVPGQGYPTLARCVFSETTEMPQVEKDTFVTELLVENDFPLPKPPLPSSSTMDSAEKPQRKKSLFVPPTANPGGKPLENDIFENEFGDGGEDDLSATSSSIVNNNNNGKPEEQQLTTMRQAYEKAIASPQGSFIRNELMNELLTKILKSRLMNVMKFLWPPQLKRIGLQYIFPRCLSFYYPKFSLPLHRFHLFPSRNNLTYNREEILTWYNSFELEEDNQILLRAEKKGVKQRAYHEWLTLEPQRMEYSRNQMGMEDSIAYQHRELNLLLQKRWQFQEERLLKLDEDLDNGEFNSYERKMTKVSEIQLTPRKERYRILMEELQRNKDEQAAGFEIGEMEPGEEEEAEEAAHDTTFAFPQQPPPQSKKAVNKKGLGLGLIPVRSPSTSSLQQEPVMTPLHKEVIVPPIQSSFPSTRPHSRGDITNRTTGTGTGRRSVDSERDNNHPDNTEQFKQFISANLSDQQQEDLSDVLLSLDQQGQTRPLSRMTTGRTIHTARSSKYGGESETGSHYDQEGALLMEDSEPIGNLDPTKFNFRIFSNLPQEYWYIFEESAEFKLGSGIYNDDEVEEIRAMQEERAKKAVEDAMEFERVLNVEKKKRQMEEMARLKREEQDRRLKENLVRRRKIREHLEDLKAQRLQRQQEEEEIKRIALEEELRRKEIKAREKAHYDYITKIENQRLAEIALMEKEEIYMKDLKIRNRELKFMEHEDITSFLIEQMQLQYEIKVKEREAELEMIYEPFEPFHFKKSRLTTMERVLYFADDSYFQQKEEKLREDLEEAEQLLQEGEEFAQIGEEGFATGKQSFSSSFHSQQQPPRQEQQHRQSIRSYATTMSDVPSALLQSLQQKVIDKEKKKFSKSTDPSIANPRNPQHNKFDQKVVTPLPQSSDPSVISFRTLEKNVPSIHSKIVKIESTTVKTHEHLPTKKKIRKFFDSTKLNMQKLNQPLQESLTYAADPDDNNTQEMTQGIAAKNDSPIKKSLRPVSKQQQQQQRPLSASSPSGRKSASNPLLPFNPYDTQWELQQSPPVSLSNLPFFVRPNSHGLNPFKSHDEQALSTPHLGMTTTTSSSRGGGSSRRGRGGLVTMSQSQSRLEPINPILLQNPSLMMMAPSQSMPILSPYQQQQRSSSAPIGHSLPIHHENEMDESFQSQQQHQQSSSQFSPSPRSPQFATGENSEFFSRPMELEEEEGHHQGPIIGQVHSTDSYDHNRTTELSMEYINSLMLQQSLSEELPYPTVGRKEEGGGQGQEQEQQQGRNENINSFSPTQFSAAPSWLNPSKSLVAGEGSLFSNSKKSQQQQKIKELYSLSADLIEKGDQKEWLEYLKTQKQLTTASLSTIDSMEKERLRRILGKGGALPVSAQLANQTFVLQAKKEIAAPPLPSSPAKDQSANKKKTKSSLLSSTLPAKPSSSMNKDNNNNKDIHHKEDPQQQSGLDFKTYSLAKTASENVLRLKTQRELLKQYISGHALLEEEQNEYFLLACEPGVQEKTILEKNESAQRFAREIHEKMFSDQNSTSSSHQPAQRPVSPLVQQQSTKNVLFSDEIQSLEFSEGGADSIASMQSSIVGGGGGGSQLLSPLPMDQSPSSANNNSSRKQQLKKKTSSGPNTGRDSAPIRTPKISEKSLELPAVPPPLTQQPAAQRRALSPLGGAGSSSNKSPALSLFHQLTDPNLSAAIGSSELHGPPMKRKSPNPFILGAKMNIPKETKKDLLMKSKQALLSKPIASGVSSKSNNNNPPIVRQHHHHIRNNKTTDETVPAEKQQPQQTQPLIQPQWYLDDTADLSRVGTRDDDTTDQQQQQMLPQLETSAQLSESASMEIKAGKSIDLFIRTPRIKEKEDNQILPTVSTGEGEEGLSP
jgi:hypothetical protein